MSVSRAGYYKWLKKPKNDRKAKREELITLVESVHKDHPSHGYRWTAAFIRANYGYEMSDNFIYKIFAYLNISAQTKHKAHSKPRKIKDKYPNLVYSNWDLVDRPRQVIVSDMTALHVYIFYIELTMYFDVFTKQIVAYRIGIRRGDRLQYINGLIDVVNLLEKEDLKEPTIIHTDQGSVYSSIAYNEIIKDKNIIRSMSRAGTPTDNPVNESLNGWIKEELYLDFKLKECTDKEIATKIIENYIYYYNSQRPCYAIGYDIPDNYYKKYIEGKLQKKNTFENRVLDPTPKFVKERKAKKQKIIEKINILIQEIITKKSQMSTFEKE